MPSRDAGTRRSSRVAGTGASASVWGSEGPEYFFRDEKGVACVAVIPRRIFNVATFVGLLLVGLHVRPASHPEFLQYSAWA